MRFIKLKVADPGGVFSKIYIRNTEFLAVQELALKHVDYLSALGHSGIDDYCLVVVKTPMSPEGKAHHRFLVVCGKVVDLINQLEDIE
jgi:hypothetical protein